MSSVSDHVQLQKSNEVGYEGIVEKKEWLTINDTNQTYEQATSVIETASLANSGKYMDYNNGYLSVPLLITLTNNERNVTGLPSANQRNRISFKQSFLSLINSITVDCNGQNLVQQNQLIDVYNHFRLLTSESWTTQNRWSTIGFYPDVVHTASFSTANYTDSVANVTANNTDINEGFVKRNSYISFDGGALTRANVGTSLVSGIFDNDAAKDLYMSHVSRKVSGRAPAPAAPAVVDASGNVVTPAVPAVSGASPVVKYSVRAVIYLKDLHPMFEALPISKGLNFKFQIFWNNTAFTASVNRVAGVVTYNGFQNVYRAYNGTNPLMIASAGGDQPNGTLTSGTARASLYIGDTCYDSVQAGINNSTGAVGKQVQLWVPAVQMKPDVEESYLSNMNKSVKYHDFYQYTVKNIGAGETFNQLVSNGISNLKAVLLVPFHNALNNNANPFDDGLPQLYAHINSFNVLVGGANVLHQDSRYTYQTFVNEFFNEFGINGNQSRGLGSSLIGFEDWQRKPYYYVNCSRVPDENAKAYRSLQVTGKNMTKLAMDYVVYAIYEKEIELNVVNGAIEKKD